MHFPPVAPHSQELGCLSCWIWFCSDFLPTGPPSLTPIMMRICFKIATDCGDYLPLRCTGRQSRTTQKLKLLFQLYLRKIWQECVQFACCATSLPFWVLFSCWFFLIFWDFCFSFTLLQLDRNVCNVVCTAADREMFCPNRTNPIDRFQSGSNASSHMETYLEIVIAKLRISESIEKLLMRQMYDFLQGSRHGTCLVV